MPVDDRYRMPSLSVPPYSTLKECQRLMRLVVTRRFAAADATNGARSRASRPPSQRSLRRMTAASSFRLRNPA